MMEESTLGKRDSKEEGILKDWGTKAMVSNQVIMNL